MSILIVLLFLCLIWYYVDRKYRKNLLKDLTSKHVFITGTDSGFGKRLALELDSKGMTVYAGCYTEKGADDLKTKASSRLHVLRIDVTKAETINEAKLFIEKHLPPGQGWYFTSSVFLIIDILLFIVLMMNCNAFRS